MKTTILKALVAKPATEAAADALRQSDLQITIAKNYWVHFRGTSAQLTEEGLIPQGFEWPSRTEEKYWCFGAYQYWIARARPLNMKNKKIAWSNCDCWKIICKPIA